MIDMIRCNLSARSRISFHTFRRHRGFTLVEVMMSTVLVAIGTTLAIPSYRDMVVKRQLTNSAEQLASFVSSVQSISTRTNRVVTVSFSRANHEEWCIGAVINADDTACECTQAASCTIDGQEFVLDQSLSNGSELVHSITITGDSYSFDPVRGLADGSLTMELHTDSRDFKLNLMVNNTGRVILCSKDAGHAIPGYDVCPLVAVEIEIGVGMEL
jgi:prepilin-type N-terminal cleavage/methylation domain-containing protein